MNTDSQRQHVAATFRKCVEQHGYPQAIAILGRAVAAGNLTDPAQAAALELYHELMGNTAPAAGALWLAHEEDAPQLKAFLAERSITRVFCADCRRSLTRARRIAKDQPITGTKALRPRGKHESEANYAERKLAFLRAVSEEMHAGAAILLLSPALNRKGAVLRIDGQRQEWLPLLPVQKDGHWVTIAGNHVYIDEATGKITQGPARLIGLRPGSSGGGKKPADKPPTKPAAAQEVARQVAAAAPSNPRAAASQFEDAMARANAVLQKTQALLDSMQPRQDQEPAHSLSANAQKTLDTLHSALASSPGLGTEQIKQYEDGLTKIAGRIPDAAHSRLARNLADVQFFASADALTEKVWQDMLTQTSQPQLGWFTRLSLWLFSSKHDQQIQNLQTELLHKQFVLENRSAGVYSSSDGKLYLDGGNASLPSGMGRNYDYQTAAMVHAHELGHVIDGRKHEFSGSKAWQTVFQKEIDQPGDPLTAYARVKPSEAFAEFARLLYGGGVDLNEVAQAFPLATAFFQEHDLWPA